MAITSAIVLYAVIWAMTFFIALPIRIKTQGEMGDVTPGTHSSSPEHHHLKKKAIITTIVATILWVGISAIILSGVISVSDFDWTN